MQASSGQEPEARARALERLTERASAILERRGFRRIEPAILQPAEFYLDQIGEDLRSRTYVFTDPDGEELCLRPDLTLPACRLYLDEHPAADAKARLSYHGPAFRYQPDSGDPLRPREFHQIGLESFGETDAVAAEAEVVSAVDECLAALGVGGAQIRLGDLSLVHGLIGAIDMPERWRRRLIAAFERPEGFRALLKQLCEGPTPLPPSIPEALLARLVPGDAACSEAEVQVYLDQAGITEVGLRSISEVTESLMAIAADRRAKPLPVTTANLIDRFIGIDVPATEALGAVAQTLKSDVPGLAAVMGRFEQRLVALSRAGIDQDRLRFTAGYGRGFAYYTGLVFQFEAPGEGRGGHLAGGGRYDGLLEAAGAPQPVPAVGAAMHSERLLALSGALTP